MNELVEHIIRLILRVTGTYLTHDSGFELPDDEWGVDNPRAFAKRRREQDARIKVAIPEAPPTTCPACGNTLDHRGMVVMCMTPTCHYARVKP